MDAHRGSATLATLLLASAAGALRVPSVATSIGRREAALQLAAAVAVGTIGGAVQPAFADVSDMIVEYDEEGRIIDNKGYTDVTGFVEIRNGPASVQRLAAWKVAENGGWVDPTLGSATDKIEMRTIDTTKATIKDLGKPEYLDYVKVLELEPDLKRADLVAAAVRPQADGILFYDFDLALPAKKCTADLATACLPSLVVLISCGVRDGKIHVMRTDADPAQWKRSGRALRLLRSSFTVDDLATWKAKAVPVAAATTDAVAADPPPPAAPAAVAQ